MFFWVRKPWIFKLDKNTGTQSLKDIIDELTHGTVKIPQLETLPPITVELGTEEESNEPAAPDTPVDQLKTEEVKSISVVELINDANIATNERGCSPIILPPRPPSTPIRSTKQFDISEIKPNLSPDEAQIMQESYR